MEIQQILAKLEYLEEGVFPREALANAIAQREQITPHLLAILEEAIRDVAKVASRELTYMGHIYAMYLLAQFREPRAYPLIVELFSLPGPEPLESTGDFVTEDLPRVLASVAAGDWKPMAAMFENRKIDEWARGAALEAMTILVVQGELERSEMISYLRRLFAGDLARDDHDVVWTALVDACADLHATELVPEIQRAYDEDRIDQRRINLGDLDRVFARPRESVLAELQRRTHYAKVHDTIREIEWWACFKKPPTDRPRATKVAGYQPAVRPKVGRNQPCPCGSGKKWKKCCGSAAKRSAG